MTFVSSSLLKLSLDYEGINEPLFSAIESVARKNILSTGYLFEIGQSEVPIKVLKHFDPSQRHDNHSMHECLMYIHKCEYVCMYVHTVHTYVCVCVT